MSNTLITDFIGTFFCRFCRGGPVSGGAFNPAVGVGPLIFDVTNLSAHTSTIMLYAISPLTGGVFAGWLYRTVSS